MDIHAAQIESNLPGEDRFHIKRKHNILACCVLGNLVMYNLFLSM